MARVLIADDHAMIRAGIRRLLAESNITDVGEAPDGEELLKQLAATHWDAVILDISMPGKNGLDILRDIRFSYPDVKVLVLSAFPERQYAVNTLRAGAGGYLAKECAPEDLLQALRIVLQGRRYVSAQLAELLATDLDLDADAPLHSRLSQREFQIFCKLAAGITVSHIGGELSISVKTVSTYRTRILEKMNLKTNADLTTYAVRNQLIQA